MLEQLREEFASLFTGIGELTSALSMRDGHASLGESSIAVRAETLAIHVLRQHDVNFWHVSRQWRIAWRLPPPRRTYRPRTSKVGTASAKTTPGSGCLKHCIRGGSQPEWVVIENVGKIVAGQMRCPIAARPLATADMPGVPFLVGPTADGVGALVVRGTPTRWESGLRRPPRRKGVLHRELGKPWLPGEKSPVRRTSLAEKPVAAPILRFGSGCMGSIGRDRLRVIRNAVVPQIPTLFCSPSRNLCMPT